MGASTMTQASPTLTVCAGAGAAMPGGAGAGTLSIRGTAAEAGPPLPVVMALEQAVSPRGRSARVTRSVKEDERFIPGA